MRKLFLTLAVLCGTSGSAWAATITVCNVSCTYDETQLQAAINAAAAGDTITIHAGDTITGNFNLPNKGVLASFITITTDASAGSLPASGVRTGPSYAAFMPKIQSAGGGLPTFTTSDGANHYKFVNVDFLNVPQGYGVIVQIGDPVMQFETQEPSDITFDRCLVRGDPVAGQVRGVWGNGKRITVINSYFDNIFAVGQDSQCFSMWNAHGPIDLENNFMECGTENVLTGGADPNMRTWMHVTGSATTTGADVATYESGHTLAELVVGQHLALLVGGLPNIQFSTITAITGSGGTGHLTWSPALTATPDAPGDIRAGVNLGAHGETSIIRRNYFTKNPNWQNGLLQTPTSLVATASTAAGALAAGTYYYKLQAFSNQGPGGSWVNGALSAEVSGTLASTGKITTTFTAVPNATVYRLWRGTTAGSENQWANVSGTPAVDDGSLVFTASGTFGATQVEEKNLFELKSGLNIQIDSNIYDTHWLGSDIGGALWEKSVNQQGQNWWNQTGNVVHEKEIFRHIAGWLVMNATEAYSGNPFPQPIFNIVYRNILIYDSTSAHGGDTNRPGIQVGNGQDKTDITFDHITLLHTMHGQMNFDNVQGPIHSLTVTNSLFDATFYGLYSTSGIGTPAFTGYVTLPTFNHIGWADGTGAYPSGATNIYPAAATFHSYFVNYDITGGVSADFHVTSGSPFHNAASDGTDMGAGIDLITAATAGVDTGTSAGAPSPIITTSSLPNGVRAIAYSQTVAASSGSSPYTWSVSAGSLPAGLTLTSSTGVISGTPTASGTSTFTLRVLDAGSKTATQSFTVQIFDPVTITTSATLPGATVNASYTQVIASTGGAAAFNCTVTGGSLPTGVTLTGATCTLSGTPLVVGSASFTITVTGSLGSSASRSFTLAIAQEAFPSGRPVSSGAIPTESAIFRRATAPTSADKVVQGDLWINTTTTPATINIATSSSPTWAALTTGSSLSGDGSMLTNLNASQLASGTIPTPVFPATLPISSKITAPLFSTPGYLEIQESGCGTIASTGFARLCMNNIDHTLRLSINGSTYTILGATGGGSGTPVLLGGNTLGADLHLGTLDGFNLALDTNGATRLAMFSNGNTYFVPNSNNDLLFKLELDKTTDDYGFGVTTANGRKAGLLGLQGTLQQAFIAADANASTDYIFGFGASQNSGSTWTRYLGIRQDGFVNAKYLTLDAIASYTCDAAHRGQFNYIAGGAGVKDIVQICGKDVSDVYAWRAIY